MYGLLKDGRVRPSAKGERARDREHRRSGGGGVRREEEEEEEGSWDGPARRWSAIVSPRSERERGSGERSVGIRLAHDPAHRLGPRSGPIVGKLGLELELLSLVNFTSLPSALFLPVIPLQVRPSYGR